MPSSLSSQELFIPVNTRKTFVASRTGRFVSAKRLFRDLMYKFNSCTYGSESFCERGADWKNEEFANGTLGVMPNNFACEFLRSLKSLLAETKRRNEMLRRKRHTSHEHFTSI